MYAIVGATGRTGGVVADRLLAAGIPVRVIGRSLEGLAPLAGRGAEPFVGSVEDAAAMARAFKGADAVYTMVPPTRTSPGQFARVGRVFAEALERAGVPHVVNLSSIGAHLPEKAGHISDFFHLEKALNQVHSANVLHLRAGFFMENVYVMINEIKRNGIMSGMLRGDLSVPRIATRDIGAVAAEALQRRDFTGKVNRELLGHRDLTMTEVAKVIGKAIGKGSLSYKEVSYEEGEKALVQNGSDSRVAKQMTLMYTGFNNGFIKWLEKRSAENSTPTSFEEFVAEEFVPRYRRS